MIPDKPSVWQQFVAWAFKPPAVTFTPALPVTPGGQALMAVNTIAPAVPPNQPGTGALIDTRTPAEQESDVHFGEIVSAAAPVNWVYKAPTVWRKFAIFNQNGCSACVAFTMAKIFGVLRFLKDGTFVPFSAGDIYIRRANKNTPGAAGGGMAAVDVFAIAGQGVTLDVLMPSQNLTDPQINALSRTTIAGEVAALFRLGGTTAIVAPVADIDAIASIIQTTQKPVMVWYYFTAAEWSVINGVPNDYNTPAVMIGDLKVTDDARGALRHSLTAVDYFLNAAGQKCLLIEDSSWFGNYNRRIITEDWHKARNWYAGYPMNFANVKTSVAVVPTAPFNQTLVFIPWNNTANTPSDTLLNATQAPDVTRLQQTLQTLTDSNGSTYFPLNVQCTGYYGAATAAAVYRWQSDNLVAPQAELDTLQGKSFGPSSVAAMNKIITS